MTATRTPSRPFTADEREGIKAKATAAFASIKSHKQAIAATTAAAAQDEKVFHLSEGLAKDVNALAEAEGRAYVWASLEQATGYPEADVTSVLLNLALTPSQDTWSGRGNDVRRAYADGIAEATKDAQMWLRIF